jgi:hypothetical protein
MAVDVELFEEPEQFGDFVHVGFFVDRGVGADHETGLFGDLDAFDRVLEHAFSLDSDVVILLKPVQVHVEEKALVRTKFVETLLDEHAVGAKVDVLISLKDPGYQLADLRIHHRLAAADGNHGRATFIHRRQALFHRDALCDGRLVLANTPASGARQIASVQRLEHQHDREALVHHRMRLTLRGGVA